MPVEPARGDDPVGLQVDEDIDHHPVARRHPPALLAQGKQQVLAEPPVEKRAQAGAGTDDAQGGEFAHDGARRLGGCNQPVLRIPVDEDIEGLARQRPPGDIAAGEKDLTPFAAVEIDPAPDGSPLPVPLAQERDQRLDRAVHLTAR